MNYRKYMFTDDELSSLINVRRDEKLGWCDKTLGTLALW